MFELDVKTYLTSRGEQFSDGTSSHTSLDFHLTRRNIHIDTKEKCQKFSMNNWKEAPMPQEHLFIIDDLAVRKLLLYAPNSFSIIRDSSLTPPMHYVYSIVDFLCMPKKRCRRRISKSVTTLKGKWLVDLRDAAAFETLDEAMEYILRYSEKRKAILETHIDCWGNYRSERIGTGGTTRLARHWKEDSKVRS
jgi:hypothetical protein